MAQLLGHHLRIERLSGMSAGAWTPVTCTLPEARTVKIQNNDLASDIEICTDPDDAGAVALLKAQQSFVINLSDRYIRGFRSEIVCYVRGAGDQPVLIFAA